MHKRFLLAASAIAVLAGCGGSGGSTIASGGGPSPAPSAAPVGSAKFTVDARTGEVKVEPISSSRAAFSGGALSFTSSLLLSEGSPERRVLRVTAKNNTQETIGIDGSMRLLFTNFQNANTPLTDLRSLVQTSTIWGTGAASTTFGGQSTASINGPLAVEYYEPTDSLYAADAAGFILKAKGGTVVRRFNLDGYVEGTATGPGFQLMAKNTTIQPVTDEDDFSLPIGSSAGYVDGGFFESRFSDINDIFMIRADAVNDFEAVVADGRYIRKLEQSAAVPNGWVTSVGYAFGGISRGVTVKDGIYIYTDGHSIRLSTPRKNAVIGDPLISGYIDGPQAGARFNTPGVLRWVGDSLFVIDSGNHRVRQLNLRPGGDPFSPSSWWVSTVSGNGWANSTDGTAGFMAHHTPIGLTKGPGETLFVADQGGHRIRKITPIANRFLANFGDSTPNPTDTAQLVNASDYVPSHPIRTPIIHEKESIAAGGTVTLREWQFVLPEGLKSFSFIVTIEAETAVPGVLPAVSNTGSGTKGSALVSLRTVAGSTAPGYSDGNGASSAFQNLRAICFSDSGDAFVTDNGNSTIRHISKSGHVKTILSAKAPNSTIDGGYLVSSIDRPLALDCSPDGTKLYFSEQSGVIRVAELTGSDPADRTAWSVKTIAGLAQNFGNVNGTGQNARFGGAVNGLVYIAENTIVVADFGFHALKRITKPGSGSSSSDYLVSILAGSSSGVSGSTDGTGTAARFSNPCGLTLTKSGYILVADNSNSRIRRVDSGGVTTTFSGSGAFGAVDAATPLAATFASPYGVAADDSGYAYVADLASSQVRRLSPTGVATTVAGQAFVSGAADGTGFTGTLSDPRALAVSPSGDVWVLEGTRIRLLQRIITN